MIGEPRIHMSECESTQTLLDASLPEGAVATTDHQTAGRGRLGRTWEDVPGASLICSVLLKPPRDRRVAELTLVGGLATAQAVERALGRTAQIKWPNDVLVDGKKVSGGLAEVRDGAVVLGIGINVNQTEGELPSKPRTPAASLRTVDRHVRDVETVLGELLSRLDDAYAIWLDRGLGALHVEIAARDFLRGRNIDVNGVEGRAVGIALDGRLEIETAGGIVAVESGEVAWECTNGSSARPPDSTSAS
jgi:BirA family biotin operon repressor/biotin-[acetyl-CoA-carboxylase] ligase